MSNAKAPVSLVDALPACAQRRLKVRRVLRSLSGAMAALAAGSRAIPLGDNGTLLRELAARLRDLPPHASEDGCSIPTDR